MPTTSSVAGAVRDRWRPLPPGQRRRPRSRSGRPARPPLRLLLSRRSRWLNTPNLGMRGRRFPAPLALAPRHRNPEMAQICGPPRGGDRRRQRGHPRRRPARMRRRPVGRRLRRRRVPGRRRRPVRDRRRKVGRRRLRRRPARPSRGVRRRIRAGRLRRVGNKTVSGDPRPDRRDPQGETTATAASAVPTAPAVGAGCPPICSRRSCVR
jgi:hypothetical protein